MPCLLGVSYPTALKNSSNSILDNKNALDGHNYGIYSNMRSYIGGYAVSDRIR